MKQLIRAFSIGLFAAGIVMLLMIFFFDNPTKKAKDLTVDEMKSELKEKGYRVITESEYISFSVKEDNNKGQVAKKQEEPKKDTNQTTSEEKEKNDKEKTDKEDDEVKTYTINIKSGMPSSEISDLLKEKNLIDDANKFTDYMEEHKYSERVQLGEFTLKTDMSFYEIAEAITR